MLPFAREHMVAELAVKPEEVHPNLVRGRAEDNEGLKRRHSWAEN
jgi:hypothetical protein